MAYKRKYKPKKKSVELTRTIAGIDRKVLEKVWRLTGNKENYKDNASKIFKLVIRLLDGCQGLVFKTTLAKIISMSPSAFNRHILSKAEWKVEIESRLARNQALETLRVMEQLSYNAKVGALVVRLKLVSDEARAILTDTEIDDPNAKKMNMTKADKVREIRKLMNKLGGDLSRFANTTEAEESIDEEDEE